MLGKLDDVVVGSGADSVGGEHDRLAGHVVGLDFLRFGRGRVAAAEKAGFLVVLHRAGVEAHAADELRIAAVLDRPAAQRRIDGDDGVVIFNEGLGNLVHGILVESIGAEDTVRAAGKRQLFGLALEGVRRDLHAGKALFGHEPVDQLVAPLQERDIDGVRNFVHRGGSGGGVVDVEVDLAVLDGRLVRVTALVGDAAAPGFQLFFGHAEVLKQLVRALSVHGADRGAADAQGELLLEDLFDGRDVVLLQKVVADAVDVAGGRQAAENGGVAAGRLFAESAGLHGPLRGSAVDEGEIHARSGEQIRSAHAAGVGGLHIDETEAAVLFEVLGELDDVVVGCRSDRVGGEYEGRAREVLRRFGGLFRLRRSVRSSGGRRSFRRAAGDKTEHHHQAEDQCQCFFHVVSPFQIQKSLYGFRRRRMGYVILLWHSPCGWRSPSRSRD